MKTMKVPGQTLRSLRQAPTARGAGHPRTLPDETPHSKPAEQSLTTLLRNKWLILLAAIVGAVLAALAARARPPIYLATAEVLIDPGRIDAPATPGGQQNPLDAVVDGHLTALASDANLRAALAALPQPARQKAGEPASFDFVAWAQNAIVLGRDLLNQSGLLGHPKMTAAAAAEAAALARLKNGLKLGQELRSTVIAVGFEDPSPTRAANVANTIARVYIDRLTRDARALDARELALAKARIPDALRQLADASDAYQAYRLTHGAFDANVPDQTAQDVAQASRQLALARAGLATIEGQLQKIRALHKTRASGAAPSLNLAIAGREDVQGSEDLRDDAAAPADPDQDVARLKEEASAYRAQVTSLEQRSATLEAAAADAVHRTSGLRPLELQVNSLSQVYSALLARRQELIEKVANPGARVSIISLAWPPSRPQTLPPIFLAPPGFVLFGLVAASLALARRHFDRKLRGESEVQQALAIPCLGIAPALPRAAKMRQRELTLADPTSPYARAVRSLLVSLSPAGVGFRPPGAILVTSSRSGEGKAVLSWSLAMAASNLGERALLIDLDQSENGFALRQLRRDPAQTNFADLLQDDDAVCKLLHRAQEDGPALVAPPHLTQDLLSLVSTPDAQHLIDRLRRAYDVIVINGPSAQRSAEIRVLACWTTAAVFAVRWGKTDRDLARAASRALCADDADRCPTRSGFFGAFLIDADLKRHKAYRFGDSGELLLTDA